MPEAEPIEEKAGSPSQAEPKVTPVFEKPAPPSRRVVVGHDAYGRPIWAEAESDEAATHWGHGWHRS